jgi:hypothetical protein
MLNILILALLVIITPAPVAVGQGQSKVDVCHITGEYDFGSGPQPIGHVISIADPAYESHLAHGDPEHWEAVVLGDGSEVCTPIVCPCYSAQELQTYFETVWPNPFSQWVTRGIDVVTCNPQEQVNTHALGPDLQYWMGVANYADIGYACHYWTVYPSFVDRWGYNLTQPELEVCRATVRQSALFQYATNQDTCP